MMKKENDWNHMTEAGMTEGSVEKINRKEMAIAVKAMKLRKVAGSSEVCAEMISASGKVGISFMTELCQNV